MSYKPTELTIAGQKFSIVYKTMDEYGELHFDKKKIYISNRIKGQVLLDTIVHEAFHAMLSISGIAYILEDAHEQLEEALVRAYENILAPFIIEQQKEFAKK
jgi:hypothetical protein